MSLLAEQQSTPEYGPGLLRFRDTATGVGLDLERATTEFEDTLLARAQPLDASGGVPIATPEDLIILNLIAFRAKDQRDLMELLSRSDLDWDYVTGWATRWQVEERLAVLRAAGASDAAEPRL